LPGNEGEIAIKQPGKERVPFGALLKRHRLAAGLTHAALAEKATLSARAISDLERGVNRAPRKETLRLLADALQLAPAQHAELEAAARHRLAAAPYIAHPSNLPPQFASFIGRTRELNEVARLLRTARLVTLTGAGDDANAHSVLEESLLIGQEVGDRWTVAASLANLGHVSRAQGDLAAARIRYEESLVNFRQIGDRTSVAYALAHLGMLALDEGEVRAAQ
jgi:transcriptional regulator with XRE-family HTH domain